MAINIAGMQQNPNIADNFQQGLLFGQQQKERERQLADQQQLRTLAPQVIAGDPGAAAKAAVIDPDATGKYQGAGDGIARRAEGLVRLLEEADARDPREAQALWQAHGVPFARQFSQGTEPTTDWAQAKPMLANLKARIEMAKSAQNPAADPTGFRELDMKARAAGLQPGTPEYKQAMNIALGREGRAATGGFGFEKVVGADGRERMGRMNPRTGVFEVYDEATGDFSPLGGPASLNGGGPPAGNAPAPMPQRMDDSQIVAFANQMAQAGVPQDQVETWMRNQQSLPMGVSATGAPAPMPVSNPALGVSQAPAEKAFATESGQQAAQIATLRERGQIEAENEGLKTAARETAEAQATKLAAVPQIITKSDQTLALINQALTHPGRATATGLSGTIDPRNYAPGTDARDFRVLLDQLKGQTFLEAFQSLKGGGAITQVEGTKAEQAIARLNTAQSDEAFEQALRELAEVAQSAKRRALDLAGGQSVSPSQAGGWSIQRVP
jgi:hypothetical protein